MPDNRRLDGGLSSYERVLAVVAHPDDESFGLGGIIGRLTKRGIAVGIMSMTHGEASTLGGGPDLDERRAEEFRRAAELLGATLATVAALPDGALAEQPLERLAGPIHDTIAEFGADALLTFDSNGVTGHPDHRATTRAVVHTARAAELPAVGWAISARVARSLNREYGAGFEGRSEFEIDYVVRASRKRQLKAIAAHQSQQASFPLVYRRLDLTGPVEWTRWLRGPAGSPANARTIGPGR